MCLSRYIEDTFFIEQGLNQKSREEAEKYDEYVLFQNRFPNRDRKYKFPN